MPDIIPNGLMKQVLISEYFSVNTKHGHFFIHRSLFTANDTTMHLSWGREGPLPQQVTE